LKFDPDEGCDFRVSNGEARQPESRAWVSPIVCPLFALADLLCCCFHDGYLILIFGPKGEYGQNNCCILAPAVDLTHGF
jgi:hypothetical protein